MSINCDNATFNEWMRKVNSIVASKLGVGVDDLPDANFMDAYTDGVDADEYAHDFVSDTLYDEGYDEDMDDFFYPRDDFDGDY